MSVGKIREFDVQSGSWRSYCDRLESYFVVNDVKDERKLPTLISVVGETAYELMVNLCSPKKPAEMTFKEVVAVMEKHLQPTPSVLAERFRFRQYRQVKGQTVAQYVAELKKMARFCDFKTTLDDNMRDQFVCGLSSDLIRQRLFAEGEINFAKSVSLALSLEAAERDSVAVEGGGGGAAARGSTTEAAAVHNVRSAGAGCMACGDFRHEQAHCKFNSYVCSRCNVKGHLRRMCPTMANGIREQASSTPNRGSARGGSTRASTGYGRSGATRGPGTAATPGSSGARGGRARNSWGNSRVHWVVEDGQLDQEEIPFGVNEGSEEPIYQMSLDKYKPA
ncbi:uncharacterized protein LOC134806785 isoform X2 [Cydia splendana]|uniref:uncharacterized protein LOC134806785 isoform X2 n=1 Tax=Cydia splendana TaxID=1100963 RepID=UPI00300C751D